MSSIDLYPLLCSLTSRPLVPAVYASFGGYMAHLIACAAKAMGFAPRCVILLDPLPPYIDTEEFSRPMSRPQAAASFLALQLATLARITELRDDAFDALLKSLPLEVAAWPEAELAIRVTGNSYFCATLQLIEMLTLSCLHLPSLACTLAWC